MLHSTLERPYTVAEIIDILKTLPPDMGCVHTRLEFDDDEIDATPISQKPRRKMSVSLLELRFERVSGQGWPPAGVHPSSPAWAPVNSVTDYGQFAEPGDKTKLGPQE
jgi:hypothetical protein